MKEIGFLKVLLVLIAIPAFGYGVGFWVVSDVNREIFQPGAEVVYA